MLPIRLHLPIDQDTVDAILKAGEGATVTHPRARTRLGRMALRGELTAAGVPDRLARTLAWAPSGGYPLGLEPKAEKKVRSRKKRKVEAENAAAADMLADQAANADKE